MISESLDVLAKMWQEAKDAETAALEKRRAIEDKMLSYINLPETFEGTKNASAGAYTIKLIGRMTRKVDADLVQEIAAEHGLSDHLSSLFRWKPEINMAAWKSASESITRPLSMAITTKPGRPSFTITNNTEK